MRRGGRTTPARGHSPSLSNTITPGPQTVGARPATGLRRRPIQAPRITKQLAHLRNQPIQRHGRQYVRSPPQPANTSPTFTRRPELGIEGSRGMLTRDSPRYAESSTACSVSSKPRAATLRSQRPRHALGYDPESYVGGPAPTAGPRILRPARTPLCACSTPPRSAADRTQHPRSRSAVLLQFGREVVLGLTTRYALRRAQPRCDMHPVQPSAKTSSTNTSTGAAPPMWRPRTRRQVSRHPTPGVPRQINGRPTTPTVGPPSERWAVITAVDVYSAVMGLF